MREKEGQLSTPQKPEMPDPTSDARQRALLQADRDDLLEVLTIRFGAVPEDMRARIAVCNNQETLERLILVAANVPDWATFLKDFDAGPNAFKMVGASYEPNYTESGVNDAPRGAHEPEKSETPDAAREEG